jgi:carbamoyl-phosphate synthase small subunit
MKAFLVLEDGSYWEGKPFGSPSPKLGEVVFNTSLSGYQEILTDPSYKDQIVLFTTPMIGNYGTNKEDMESKQIYASGTIVKEYVSTPSNFRSTASLDDFLKTQNTPGIYDIDTRMITRILREKGALNGGIFFGEEYQTDFLAQVKNYKGIKGSDLARVVSTTHSYNYGTHTDKKLKLAVYDFGVKKNILDLLDEVGFNVSVYPAQTPIEELLKQSFDAYFLSNGPGDPEPLDYAISASRSIIAKGIPVFGICLGHQILGQAMGMKTGKLKFGHRGGNHPVRREKDQVVEITAQNHGFVVLGPAPQDVQITHINLFDQTIAGFESKTKPVMAIQYHPESSPGPHDSRYLFEQFYQMAKSNLKN